MKCFQTYIPANRKINPALLWDYDFDEQNLRQYTNIIVTRTLKMGRLEDFYAAFDLVGGIKAFAKIANDKATDLNNKELNFMCHAFNLKKERTACYIKKQLREKHINS